MATNTSITTQYWSILRQWVYFMINKDKPVPKFNVSGLYLVRVVRVYDGDTFFGEMLVDRSLFQFSFRMLGYNSAEMKPRRDTPNREQVLVNAHASKNKLQSFVRAGEFVYVDVEGFGKYGRNLATVYETMQHYKDGVSVNQQMIEFEGSLEHV